MLGAGPIGLLIAVLLKATGANQVAVVEPSAARRRALDAGADFVTASAASTPLNRSRTGARSSCTERLIWSALGWQCCNLPAGAGDLFLLKSHLAGTAMTIGLAVSEGCENAQIHTRYYSGLALAEW